MFTRASPSRGSRSTNTALFKLILAGNEEALRTRIYEVRQQFFGTVEAEHAPIFLTEDILDQFTVIGGNPKFNGSPTGTFAPPSNSHLALIAMVGCWAHRQIQPFDHFDLAAIPIFRIWIGVAEYLFRSTKRLDSTIRSAVYDVAHRSDDLEFVIAARGWSSCFYKWRFLETASFFENRFEEASAIGSDMTKAISQS
ncbi:hypothetical protein EDB19DRAFT_1696982 [Suillus lakei]|nr:hypothetical protein EDB19DRAFT_1696982 [Suillus lakei]